MNQELRGPPPVRAVRRPLEGFIAQVWVEAYRMWFDMSGCPLFKTDGQALDWARDQQSGWPT